MPYKGNMNTKHNGKKDFQGLGQNKSGLKEVHGSGEGPDWENEKKQI